MPERLKSPLLLTASLFFYAWGDAGLVWVLLGSIAANYGFGHLLERTGPGGGRKAALSLALGANLGLLFYFKYFKFAVMNLAALGLVDPNSLDFSVWRLPLGISFFTFGNMAYLIDLYRGKTRAERNPAALGLYTAHFAKIVAGPIVRYTEMRGELKDRRITLENFAQGTQRFVIGLAKKVLVANTVAQVADEIFKAWDRVDMPTAWLGILCYTFQIYYDFSGYSDMAIGLGRMFGFSFRENFQYPYISQTIQEFWRRWHISLSEWFRDYLYIPLGGSRKSEARTIFNLIVVFLLCGLWHGASWNFIVWGLYHGFFLMLERLGLARGLQNTWRPLRHLYAIPVIMVGWVFFRADDLKQALGFISAMFSFRFDAYAYYTATFVNSVFLVTLCFAVAGSTPIARSVGYFRKKLEEQDSSRLVDHYDVNCSIASLVLMVLLLIASTMQMAISTYDPFIYARF